MENNVDNIINDFIGDNEETNEKKKIVKSDFTIIERVDKIIIAENGKQLLREVY
jgi:hypothetical protein